jgi:RimJ/RimL family protein N-acetyltransferase
MVRAMNSDIWPFAGLRLTTANVELRFPTANDLGLLADLAAREGYHPSVPWLSHRDDSPSERARRLLQFVWGAWGSIAPGSWVLTLAASVDNKLVGTQSIYAYNFAVTREATTGSWVTTGHRGKGIGTSMRNAILHLGFDGLGAHWMRTTVRKDNAASLAVTAKHRYAEDGLEIEVHENQAFMMQRFRLDRETWHSTRRQPVEVHGLDDIRPFLEL